MPSLEPKIGPTTKPGSKVTFTTCSSGKHPMNEPRDQAIALTTRSMSAIAIFRQRKGSSSMIAGSKPTPGPLLRSRSRSESASVRMSKPETETQNGGPVMSRAFILILVLTVFLSFSACGGSGGTTSPTETTYTIGGVVSGLYGTGLMLQDNGIDSLQISANGNFTFEKPVASG